MGNVSEKQRSELMNSTAVFSGAMLIVGALCVSGCVSACSLKAVTEVTVDDYEARVFTSSQGDTIPYRLFIPRGYDADKKYPLVLFHHGGGGSGNDNRRQFEGPCPREWAGPERQAKNPCFIVAPQIPRRKSRDRENRFPRTEVMRKHIQTIHEILDSLEAEFSIDTSREYVTGLSMGGECTWMSIIERPDRFAAAVPICAGDKFIGMDAAERGRKFAQFPLWIFHGDADDVISVEVSREVVKALRDAGGNPKYTEYPGVDHGSWEIAYRDPELIEWLFAKSTKPAKKK
jgi:predicted peptidase